MSLFTHVTKTELIERIKNLQSALEASQKEYAAVHALFTQERLAKIEHFAKISHELRSPLNSILLLCNVLTQNDHHNLSHQQKENIIAIDAAGKDLLYIINDMIDQSNRPHEKIKVEARTFVVDALVKNINSMYTAQFSQKNISFLIKNTCENDFSITSDQNKITQILRNLLSNAYKYTPLGGSVEMRLSHSSESLIIEVVDSGPGMSQEEQKTIFNPFVLGEEGFKNKGASLGLGLSIAKKISDSLNATLTLQSTEGAGTIFTLTLPIHASFSSAMFAIVEPKSQAAAPLVKGQESLLKNKKILLVEHRLPTIYAFRRVLLTYGAELTHVLHVLEALDYLKHRSNLKQAPNIDLVICSYYEGYTPEQLKTHFDVFPVPMIAVPTLEGEALLNIQRLLSQLAPIG